MTVWACGVTVAIYTNLSSTVCLAFCAEEAKLMQIRNGLVKRTVFEKDSTKHSICKGYKIESLLSATLLVFLCSSPHNSQTSEQRVGRKYESFI